MHKLEKIIAISKMIDSMNEVINFDFFKIELQFNVNDGRLLENDLPDTIVIVLQHEEWERNSIYYEVYINFRTMQEVMNEGESFDVTIDIDKFEDTCREWISKAKEYFD